MVSSNLLSLVPVDARYERRLIPDADNALPLLVEAARHFRDYDQTGSVFADLMYGRDDGQPAEMPTGDDYDRVNGVLEANRQAFQLIDAGIRRSTLQMPPVNGLEPIQNESQRACHPVGEDRPAQDDSVHVPSPSR